MLAKKVEELANAKGKEKFTMAEFRTVTKLSRGLTIPFLEFFDRSGLTTRFSTGRRIKNSCSTVFGCDDYESKEEKRFPVGRLDFKSREGG